MRNLIEAAFKAGMLTSIIKGAQKNQQGEQTGSEDTQASENAPNKKAKESMYPRDRRISHALDALDALSFRHRKGMKR
jgi:hypothetical protein